MSHTQCLWPWPPWDSAVLGSPGFAGLSLHMGNHPGLLSLARLSFRCSLSCGGAGESQASSRSCFQVCLSGGPSEASPGRGTRQGSRPDRPHTHTHASAAPSSVRILVTARHILTGTL